MAKCCIRGCNSNSRRNNEGLSFFRFSKKEDLRKLWIDNIGSENIKPAPLLKICSKHFEESCINRTLDVVRLKDDVVPTLFPFTSSSVQPRLALSEKTDNSGNTTASPQHNIEIDDSMPIQREPLQLSKSAEQDFMDITMDIDEPKIIFTQQQSTSLLPKTAGQCSTHFTMGGDSSISIHTQQLQLQSTSGVSKCLAHDTMVSEDKAVAKIEKVSKKLQQQRRKIKALSQKCRRLKQKVLKYQNLVDELKSKNLVTHEGAILLEECAGSPEFLSRQISRHRGEACPRSYGEDLRKFALTLNFLSPKAYRFVRATYKDCLPHHRTLSKWYQRVDAEPGFTAEAFKTLKIKTKNSPVPIICTLVIDEMAIRKCLCWDNSTKKFYGRINTGIAEESDSTEEATECFVMLLTAINESWKLPVGYFFINTLKGEQKAHLVQICVQMTEEAGVKIVALTCDGPAANFAMLKELGCDLQKSQKKTDFTIENQRICAFIDPCHCIKLIRNAFGDMKIMIDHQGRKINFNYIKLLLDLQEKEGLHLGTKLSKAHVDFTTQKMKVRLATQLFSNSVADALEFCENKLKLPQFEGCSATALFIRTFNNLFDCLNSRSLRPPGWKKALFCKNYADVLKMFDETKSYINNLKLETGQSIVTSRRKTGFIGMLVNMSSAINLYQSLIIEAKIINYLPLYKISQDHLELFFSSIRARGGYNNNPNAVQFKAAYKRLLIRAEIRDHGIGNCIPLEQISILNCPSTNNPINSINILTDRNILIEEDDSSLYEEYLDHLQLSLSIRSKSFFT